VNIDRLRSARARCCFSGGCRFSRLRCPSGHSAWSSFGLFRPNPALVGPGLSLSFIISSSASFHFSPHSALGGVGSLWALVVLLPLMWGGVCGGVRGSSFGFVQSPVVGDMCLGVVGCSMSYSSSRLPNPPVVSLYTPFSKSTTRMAVLMALLSRA